MDKEKTQRLYIELPRRLPQGLYNFESDIIVKENAYTVVDLKGLSMPEFFYTSEERKY